MTIESPIDTGVGISDQKWPHFDDEKVVAETTLMSRSCDKLFLYNIAKQLLQDE